jgi:1-acyl-sn-glycerol-3-phosphate acyltransferase
MTHHPLRLAGRLIWLTAEFVLAGADFLWVLIRAGGSPSIDARARWLQRGSRRVLRVFQTGLHVSGRIPTSGLLVCNHLSYLDILVLGSVAPSIFVAKLDVRRWPILGWFARLGGTLFVDRKRRADVRSVNQALQVVLDQGALVVLFPEGTSSDGRTVLPFKSALLEPAASCSHPLAVSAIAYRLEDGDVGEEVCYWKDMTLLPHLLNLLSKRRVWASLHFSRSTRTRSDRKELARQLRSEILGLREGPGGFRQSEDASRVVPAGIKLRTGIQY